MSFLNRLGDFARNIGDKANDALETNKLNGKISVEKTAIAECMRQIGECIYAKYQAGEFSDPALAELFATIDAHNRAINETQAEIARIQEENAAQAAQAQAQAAQAAQAQAQAQAAQIPQYATPTPVSSAPAGESVACPSCGVANPVGTKFCCECGTKLEIPAPVATERTCPGCGAQVPIVSKFCGECGHRFD